MCTIVKGGCSLRFRLDAACVYAEWSLSMEHLIQDWILGDVAAELQGKCGTDPGQVSYWSLGRCGIGSWDDVATNSGGNSERTNIVSPERMWTGPAWMWRCGPVLSRCGLVLG